MRQEAEIAQDKIQPTDPPRKLVVEVESSSEEEHPHLQPSLEKQDKDIKMQEDGEDEEFEVSDENMQEAHGPKRKTKT